MSEASTGVDLLVVGGGINGAGIARDAAGRGLTVALVEQHDLAAHTSSASTKLIHGGLRYLEQREFRLVREALAERERLMAIAPHLVRPLRFVLPYVEGLRPRWLLRLGLFVYDHLKARERLAGSRELVLEGTAEGAPLRAGLARGFEYWDCSVNDSRLVVLNALDAAERGATVRVRTRLAGAQVREGRWEATLVDAAGATHVVHARALVNATGAWANDLLQLAGLPARRRLQLVKGSHLIFPRLHEGEHAYLLQSPDRRVVFVIPFGANHSLVGTTDVPWSGDPGSVRIDQAEVRYLLECVNRFLRVPVTADQAVGSFSGVRALYDEDAAASAQQLSRDYHLELQHEAGAPALTVYGGKITTYRRMAEHALETLLPALGAAAGESWTAAAPLPGGDLPDGDAGAFAASLLERWPLLAPALLERLARDYGTRALRILEGVRTAADLGEDLGGTLSAREVDYLCRVEWARTPEDVLRRRTWLGLPPDEALEQRLAAYFSTKARSMT